MEGYTELVVLLDRSGSMQDARADHEGGLNSFVEDQKDLTGEVRFTLIQFDTEEPCQVVYDGVPVREVGKCSLVPRGGTPLLDAIGRSVAHVKGRLAKQTAQPGALIFMIITDGQENQSQEFTKTRVKTLIEEQEKAGWKFLFLGANVDAFAEASALGIGGHATLDFANTPMGVRSLYTSNSSNVRAAHGEVLTGGSLDAVYANLNYTDEQREAATGTFAADKKGK